MYSTQTETKCGEQLACIILAAQVLSLGLWHARPRIRHQCGRNAPASRCDIGHHGRVNIDNIAEQHLCVILTLFHALCHTQAIVCANIHYPAGEYLPVKIV